MYPGVTVAVGVAINVDVGVKVVVGLEVIGLNSPKTWDKVVSNSFIDRIDNFPFKLSIYYSEYSLLLVFKI
jgi:hypothetical protein